MASMRPRSRRQQPATRKPRSRRLLLEQLEDRLIPAANLLVSTTVAGTEQVLREFTPTGGLVRTALLPPVNGVQEPGRDLVYDQTGKVHVYAGTFDPALSSYNLAGGGWTQRTFQGWSTFNNVSYGGIGVLGNYVFVTDMTTYSEPADEAKGVVRFNLADGTSARFLTSEEPQDLTVGKDGFLYLLSGNTVKGYDPGTFALRSTVALPAGDFRGIAVNAVGEIFAASWGGQVYRLKASGTVLGSVTLAGVSNPLDIDVSGDGRVAVGTGSGHVVQMNENLTGITTFASGGDRAFVAFGPDQAQSPPAPTPPIATIVRGVTQAEGNSGTAYAVFTVTLTEPSVDPVAFKYTTTNGTATSNSDYWFTDGTRVLLPGQTSTQILVNVVGDTAFEPDENYTLSISDPVGITIKQSSVTGTITNDDPSTPYFIVDDVSRSEGGQYAGTLYSFLVKLSTPSAQAVTVSYATRDNSAVAGSDYTARTGTLTFSPGQLQQAVDVTVLGDLAVEPDETFFFELSNATNANITDPQAVGTILNDDWINQLSVSDAYVVEGNSGTTSAVFAVTLSQVSPGTVTVDYFTTGADATAGVDFVPTTGTLTFAPGQTSATIRVPVVGDTQGEPDEYFYVDLTNPTGASLADYYGVGTIANDDASSTPPAVQPDAYDLSEDQTFTSYYYGFGVLANDYSPNGGLTASLVSGPAHGTLGLSPDGNFTYTPAPNYYGTDSFVYRATDSAGLSAPATVTLHVWGMDDPTQLTVPGPQTVAEDGSLTFSAARGNAITVTDIESPRLLVALLVQDGVLTLRSTAGLEFPYADSVNNSPHITFYADDPAEANAALDRLRFTPNPDYNGPVYFSVMVQDTTVVSSYPVQVSANVPITVTPVNDAPVAAADSFQATEDQALTVYGMGVLSNDSDPDRDMLSAVLVSGPAHGTVTLSPGGGFTYTPAPNYNGTDGFTYSARDPGGLLSAPATVSLSVWPMDDPTQVAAPGPQTIAEDTSLTFSAANGNAITVTDIESPRLLVVVLAQNGILTLPNTANLEFPDPASPNNSPHITFYADDPAEANAALNGLVFTPDPNYFGSVYFNVMVQDTTSVYYPVTASAYVPITVTSVNDAPVAVDDSYAVQAGAPFVVSTPYYYGGGSSPGVLANDRDVEWDLLSAVLVSGPAHGTLALNADGTFTYTAEATYSGTDTFTYRASDGRLQSNLATVTFTVTRNQPPVSAGDAYAVNEDGSLSVAAPGVLGNDSDPEGQPLTAQLVAGPAHGTLTLNPNGSFTYIPVANYYGPDGFWYRASDGANFGDAVAVTLTVNPVNDAPAAGNDSYSVDEDSVLTIAAAGVLGNDLDVDSATLSASPVSGPSHGVLSFNANGSFTYTPSANYYGSDSFTYKANDGQSDSNVATVAITVSPVNDAPVAVNDAYSVNEDQTLTVAPTPGVTSLTMVSQPGDYIGQGQTYSYTPQTGTFMVNRNFDNGVSVYYSGGGHWWNLDFAAPFDANLTPGSYANATRWPFQAAGVAGLNVSGDGRGSNTLTGSFTVTEALYAVDGKVLRFAATFEQHSEGAAPALTGTINFNQGGGPSGVLLNDSDAEGSPLTLIVVSGPAHGTLGMNVDGSFTYKPAANYNGADGFTYKVSDGTAESNVATVSLTVNPVNDFPTANNDSYVVAEDGVLTVGAPGVLANDSDVDGDSLTATLVTSPTHGSLAFNADGPFTYTPHANYNGSDSFKYAAYDGTALSFIRTVTLSVTSVNDAPAANNDSYTTAEDTPLTVAAAGVLGNDADVEGSALTALLVGGPAHGTLALNNNGSFTYTPDADYNGPDSFTYKANDGSLDSNTATVSITVNAVNDAPLVVNDSYSTDEDARLTVAATGVLGNDTDVEADALTAVLVAGPTHGTLTLNANGSFGYTPDADYNGPDGFSYKANDGALDSATAMVSITVNAVNDAPVAVNDSYSTNEDTALTVNAPGVLGYDTDVEGSTLRATLVAGPTHGTLALNADGSFVYTPDANYNGADGFTYKANDGAADSNVATVSLTVSAGNDAPTATDDAYTVAEDQALAVAAPGVLGNDGDVDGDSLSAVLVSGPAHGTVNLNADGSFTYTPNADYHGSDGFSYKANDGRLDSNVATVTLAITLVNDVPLADAGPDRTVSEGSTVAFSGVASDADGDPLSYVWNFGDGATATGAAPTHLYADNGSYTVTLTVNDGQGGATSASLVVTVLNVAPTLTLSGASAVNEASTYTLILAASDPGPDTIANWTIAWGDGSVQTAAGNPGSVSHTYADGARTYTISATARDEDGTYNAGNTLNVTVNNVAPTASISGPATGARGQVRTFALGAADPSAVDQAGGFTFNINWGDGSSQGSTGPASQQVGHVYTAAGTFTVQVTAADKDGGASAPVQQTITVKAVDVQAGTLVIGGTTADDIISVSPADASGNLAVTINGVSQGTFSSPAQVVVYGQSGNDQIKLVTKKVGATTYYVTASAALFGDAGNDTLDARGSTANNILVGGAGTDTLQGGSGRDLLIGGAGGDTLHGNGGDDIVIGNSTDYDSNLNALNALMAEWGRTDADYATRVNHLNGSAGGALNGGYFLNNTTVHDDAALDQLYGEAGSDWFFYTASGINKDKLNDFVTGEVATAQ